MTNTSKILILSPICGTKVEVVADSISKAGGRITTLSLTYPRYIHSELMTHRVFSRNASSSRAIPVKKMIAQVLHNPVIPIHFGQNKAGMQADAELSPMKKAVARRIWLLSRYAMCAAALLMVKVGLHKQIANRVLEPWMYITTLVSATEWENFFILRNDKNAHPDIHHLAQLMLSAMNQSTPIERVDRMDFHLPFVTQEERAKHPYDVALKLSVARCARVSYLNHDNSQPSVLNDCILHDNLLDKGHMSPFEHQAYPVDRVQSGNFVGWVQYRKYLKNECRHGYQLLETKKLGV